MRISDWSSDVCSSDLQPPQRRVDVLDAEDRFGEGKADAMRRHRALRPDRLRNPAQRLIQPPRQHRPETGCTRPPRQIVKLADMAQAGPVQGFDDPRRPPYSGTRPHTEGGGGTPREP